MMAARRASHAPFLTQTVPADRRILLWSTPHSRIAQENLDKEISLHLQSIIYEKILKSVVPETLQSYGAGGNYDLVGSQTACLLWTVINK